MIWDKEKRYPLIMGILNVTPDSFYDGGRYISFEDAVAHALEMVEMGADIIDVGGESTRPGASFVPAEVEISRVCPVIEEIAKKCKVPISIDTTKAVVAREAIRCGASMVNDISGLTFDDEMVRVVADANAHVVISHIRGTPQTMQQNVEYDDLLQEVRTFLQRAIEKALAAGVMREKIIIDPGIGFGKSLEGNYEILNNISFFKELGFPLLIGLSRKSLIGKLYDADEDRLPATIALNAIAVYLGADIVRVHDVRPHVLALKAVEMLKKVGFDGSIVR
ncbi:MAG: dihydropteroate synthase [Spirochaetes bacterium]|nr:dihydropteroate synthase [Spirochaetota bacterium]